MKTFKQFQEDAYKPPKTVNKVAKQMEKDGVKFPDAKAIDDIKKFTGKISDFPDNKHDADFKNLLRGVVDKATRRNTPIVGRDTKYVELKIDLNNLEQKEKLKNVLKKKTNMI